MARQFPHPGADASQAELRRYDKQTLLRLLPGDAGYTAWVAAMTVVFHDVMDVIRERFPDVPAVFDNDSDDDSDEEEMMMAPEARAFHDSFPVHIPVL